jgi:hypothetical protein
LITSRNPKRPYGAQVTFQLLNSEHIGELENVVILFESEEIATIRPGRSASWEGGKRYNIVLEGFATAAEAEFAGLRLAQALLLLATNLDFGLRLNYHAHEPAEVFQRFASEGDTTWGEGVAGRSQSVVLAELVTAYINTLLDRSLLLSLELYCTAQMEMNERARFLTVVSALEPLAKQHGLGPEVCQFVDHTLASLAGTKEISENLRESLAGRLHQLREESVRQALFRLCQSWFPGKTDVRKRLDRAYALRSELLHEGKLGDPDTDLLTETSYISKILRTIYAQASGRALQIP